MLSNYRYGPVSITEIEKYENSMHIIGQGLNGHTVKAVYENCIYWQIEKSLKGERLLIVEEKSEQELLNMRNKPCVSALNQNAANVENLIRQWHDEGMHFFIHYVENSTREFIVVAEKLCVE